MAIPSVPEDTITTSLDIWAPANLSHTALGILVSPATSSDTTQVRLYSDPATRLPDLLMLTEIAGDGTAIQERHIDIEKYDSANVNPVSRWERE